MRKNTPEQAEKKRLERNARVREWNAMLRSAHICRQCKQTDAFTLAGHPLCAECREKDRERQRKFRESDGGERNRQKAKKNRDKRAAAGLCVYCGKRTVQPGRSTCITCSTKQKERNRQRDIANGMNWPRGANGYCWQCNKQPVKEGFKLCPDCYEKKVGIINANRSNNNQVWRKYNDRDKQKGQAAHCKGD